MGDRTSAEVRTLSKESQGTKELQQIEEETGAVDIALNYEHIQVKREKNPLLPINQLPTELLVDIFIATIGAGSRRIYNLKVLASVAWRWDTTIKHTPMLWATLDSRMPPKLVKIAIQRSGDLPLTIRAYCGLRWWSTDSDMETRNASTSDEDHMAFLTTIFPKLARWKHARLKLGTAMPDLMQNLEQPAPLLEKFSMKIQHGWEGPQVDLFRGHCPSLTEIDISGFNVPWSSRIFQNLLSISIGEVWHHGPCGLPPGHPPGHPPQDPPLVDVPHLQSLRVWDVSASSTQHILSRIRAPTLTELVVNPTMYRVDTYHLSTFLDAALGHFNQTIRSGIEHAHGLYVSINSDNTSISVSTRRADSPGLPKNEDVMLEFYHQPILEGLQLCLAFLLPSPPLCPPISLDIFELSDVMESDLYWMLESGINDKVTEVYLRTFQDEPFLSFLCTARNCGGTAKWPFPRLKTLTLPEWVSGEEAVRLIRQRYAPAPEDFNQSLSLGSGDLVFEPVDPLVRLELEDVRFDHVDYNRLANIVGNDVLVRAGGSDASD
ncbi:hypothetical protein FS837_008119 [Tulasnella sp. UAMH 9824]|nr:hypothetical protein FS837_008119 [Tulasnella sp. UAMH 9824]